MAFAPGDRLGAYEIIAAIGAGGMGEVYRARDTRLHRDVAIKALPDLVANDPERVARFQREATLLASLNHPNIAQIHGVEDVAGSKALVLEFVGGPTLSDVIAKGPIPVDEAIVIAKQITEALVAAHDQGVVHRDLKPANIKLTADGTVKVLDFGLAKAMTDGSVSSAHLVSQSPTITSPAATLGGVILGTAAYMSPEQARGKTIDKRSDIWAFGCVLYEMLTGRRAFDGEDVADVLSKVLQREPDFSALHANVSPSLRTLLRRCLEKDRKGRLADIADARYELDEAARSRAEAAVPVPTRRRGWLPAALVLAAVMGAAGAALAVRSGTPATEAQPITFTLELPANTTDFRFVSVSPDGQLLAFNAGPTFALWLRRLDATGARMLAGTEGAGPAIWSPDSRAIVFSTDETLKRIDLASGAVTTVVGAVGVFPSWGRSNTFLFSQAGELRRVSATGGSPARVLKDVGPFSVPTFLPDGERFVFADMRTSTPQRGAATIYLGSLSSTEKREVVRAAADSRVLYANGHLLYIRDRKLMAHAFDLASGTVTGDPVPLAENVWPGFVGMTYFSASDTGVVAFPVLDTASTQLAWLDRSGKLTSRIAEPGEYSNPTLSPDGTKIAVCMYDPRERSRDIWVFDLERGTRTRVTQDPADDMNPVWSPDGLSIAFSSDRRGQRDVFRRSSDGGGEDVLLIGSPEAKSVADWSPDGKLIMFAGPFPTGGNGVSFVDAVPRPDPSTATRQLQLAGFQSAQFSPDGRWVVFMSGTTGRPEIYAKAVSGNGGTITVSTKGGIQPRWSQDGKEIFYLSAERDRILAVPVTVGDTLRAGIVRELFAVDVADAVGSHLYDVSPDGQRFLVNVRVGPRIAPITVMVNWPAMLKKPAS